MGGVCGKQNRYVQNRLSSDSDSGDSEGESSTSGSSASSSTASSRPTQTSATSKGVTKTGLTPKFSVKTPTKVSYTQPPQGSLNAKNIPKSPLGQNPVALKQKFLNVPNSPHLQNKPPDTPITSGPTAAQPPPSPDSKMAAKSSVSGAVDSTRLVLNVKDLDSNMGYLVVPKKPIQSSVQSNNAPTAFNYTKQVYQQELPTRIADFRQDNLPMVMNFKPIDAGILNKAGVYYENKAEIYIPGQQEMMKWEQTAITPQEQKFQFYYDVKKEDIPTFNPISVPQYQMQIDTTKLNTQQPLSGQFLPSFPMESAKLLMVECGKESNYIPLPKVTDYCVQMNDQQTQNKVVQYFEENIKQAIGPRSARPLQFVQEQPCQLATLNANRTVTSPMPLVAVPMSPPPLTNQAYTNYARFQAPVACQVPMMRYMAPPVPAAASQPPNLRLNAEQLSYRYNQQYGTPAQVNITATQNTLPATQHYNTEQRILQQQQHQQQLPQQPLMATAQPGYIGADRFGAAQDYNLRQLKVMQSGLQGESRLNNAPYGASPPIVTQQATLELIEHLCREIKDILNTQQRKQDQTFTQTIQHQQNQQQQLQNEILSKIEELCLNFKKLQLVYENTIRDLTKDNYFNSQIGKSDSVLGQRFNEIKSNYKQISSQVDVLSKSTLEFVNNCKNPKTKALNQNANISSREVENLNNQVSKLTKAIQTLKQSYNPEILKTIYNKN